MIETNGPIALLSESKSAVYFSKSQNSAGTYQTKSANGTALPIRKLQNKLDVAFWGEDNRFPQNIEQQLAYCGVAKSGLDWKARFLWGNGIIPGKVSGYKEDGSEIFTPLDRAKNKAIFDIIGSRPLTRFYMEFLQDWAWFGNCFPEIIFSKDTSKISHFVHQESCDSRYKQVDQDGQFSKVYLSKMWGASADQYAKFDPKKVVRGLLSNPSNVDQIDKKFLKTLDCIDMYNPLESTKKIAAELKGKTGLKSAILPVNYPSVNKTYYQVPAWDGARLSGWIEIASKIPAMIKMLYSKAFRLKYHVEVPENFFARKYGIEAWAEMDEKTQKKKREDLLKRMDEYLSGEENAYKTFVSFFETSSIDHQEYARIKITQIKDESNISNEIITQSAADVQILIPMGVNPVLFGAGTVGTGKQMTGGSNLREALLIYVASLKLERELTLEPLYLMRDFNGWDSDIEFRHRDIILTTLDTGAGTKKTLS